MTVFVDTTSQRSAVSAFEQAMTMRIRCDLSVTNSEQQTPVAVRDDVMEAVAYARLQLDGVMRELAQ